MLKFLRFNIEVFGYNHNEVRLWIYKHNTKYEILAAGLYPRTLHLYENKRLPVKNSERLAEWETFDVNSWDDEYFWPAYDGTSWTLTYREEGKKARRISGSNAYPPQWKQFIEWLDALMPKVNFAKYIEEKGKIDEDESN